MAGWFSGSSSAASKKTSTTSKSSSVPMPQEWPCACEHCFGIISKLPGPSPSPVVEGSISSTSNPLPTQKKDGKWNWQAAAKSLGEAPQGYTRYPFLEQYAQNVLKLEQHQIKRLRVDDLRKVLQQRRIVIPEIFDAPDSDYEGPREFTASSSTSTSSTSTATTIGSSPSAPQQSAAAALDINLLAEKITEALRLTHSKNKKKKRGKHRGRNRRVHESSDSDQGEEEENPAENAEEQDEDDQERDSREQEEEQEERPRRGGRRH